MTVEDVVVAVDVVPVDVDVGAVPLPIPGQDAAYATPPLPAIIAAEAAIAMALRSSFIVKRSFGWLDLESPSRAPTHGRGVRPM
ncbi:MAG TPA: hypothetical protein VHX88_11560 [Solirubrobacteraceae bacterium]|nr:hypothetical protein [Solirubrobacteraceae bacterium]